MIYAVQYPNFIKILLVMGMPEFNACVKQLKLKLEGGQGGEMRGRFRVAARPKL